MQKLKKEGKCIFCEFQTAGCKIQREILGESENVFLLKDINQASSTYHLLAISKRHIDSVASLTENDLPLLDEMENEIFGFLKKSFPDSEYRLGFHVPPYISVPHLHMHGFALPIKNCFTNWFKYGVFLISNDRIRSMVKSKINTSKEKPLLNQKRGYEKF